MTTLATPGTARILSFPKRGRFLDVAEAAAGRRRFGAARDAGPVVDAEAWYHEAALRQEAAERDGGPVARGR